MKKYLWIALALLTAATGCILPEEEDPGDLTLDPADATLQTIYRYQDRRATDSLLPYLDHEQARYRYAATTALASVQDEAAIPALATRLTDEVEAVRTAAAYALGQTGDEAATPYLIEAFAIDSSEQVTATHTAILEAVGRIADADTYLPYLADIKTYTATDTALIEGQMLALYRYLLRNETTRRGTERVVQVAADPAYDDQARMIAAHYLARYQGRLDTIGVPLTNAYRAEDNDFIKMALAIALGKVGTDPAQDALLESVNSSVEDYRTRLNALRALANYPYADVQAAVYALLTNDNPHISRAAAYWFLENGIAQDARAYWDRARQTDLPTAVRTGMYAAANKHLSYYYSQSKARINNELKARLDSVSNAYERADVIGALAAWPWNYDFIKTYGFAAEENPVRLAAIQALADIARDPDFDATFRGQRRIVRNRLNEYFREAIDSGDMATIYVAADVIAQPELGFKEVYESADFLKQARTRLQLPRDTEADYALQQAIATMEGRTVEPAAPEYNRPIDFSRIQDLKSARIKTSRGDIVLELYPTMAPGSVANFVQLASDNYYRDRVFHRVVPNFVVQGGGPRGDGMGGEDYSIRTEVPQLYYHDEGYLGMASAGKDTEGVQWFITHSPTPHLDGRYTIFGKVTDGMDVVHRILPGDRIEAVVIE